MKKIIFLLLLAVFGRLSSQIALQNTYVGGGLMGTHLVKLQNSGYKYFRRTGATIELFNTNHSLFKTITVPTVLGTLQNVSYISENTFDTDNLIEYAVITYSASGTVSYRTYIFKENGTQIFFRDSATIAAGNNGSPFLNQDGVYFDGTATKMKLSIYAGGNAANAFIKHEIYSLPGTMPCAECSSTGTVSGIAAPASPGGNTPVFYPNPVSDQLKLKYELPRDYKNAEINIYDLQGKRIGNMKVTDAFDFIYLPSDYNNGLYLYELKVDGKIIKTEKIILNK